MVGRKSLNGFENRKYIAFISYRHKQYDKAVAKKIHTLIESYHVPKQIRGVRGKKLGIAFRDQEELPASGNLTSDIREALDHSEYLIVVCTPDTPGSVWVQREIDFFLQKNDRSHVLTILAAGDPDSSFPRALTHVGEEDEASIEPLAANIIDSSESKSLRKLSKEALRLFAAMLGCPYDSLVRREQKRRQRRISLAFFSVMVILAGYIGILLNSNIAITEKSNELIKTNTLLEEQKRAVQINESHFLTLRAQQALRNNDIFSALKDSINALPHGNDSRPYFAAAENVLDTALLIFQPDSSTHYIASHSIENDYNIKYIAATENGERIIAIDIYDDISVFDPYTYCLLWSKSLFSEASRHDKASITGEACFFIDNTNSQIITLYNHEILVLSIETGTLIWKSGDEYEFEQITLSPNNDILICLAKGLHGNNDYCLFAYETAAWNALLKTSFSCPLTNSKPYSRVWSDPLIGNTVFSEDGRYFLGTLIGQLEGGDFSEYYYLFDTQSGDLKPVYSDPYYDSVTADTPILWMGFQMDEENEPSQLTIVKELKWLGQELLVEIVDLKTGERILTNTATPHNNIIRIEYKANHCVLRLQEDLLVVSAGHQLYLIKISTGEILEQTNMPETVVGLFKDEGKKMFGFVLSNGMYALGNWIDIGFLTSEDYIPSFNLGAPVQAISGKYGFIKTTAKGISAGDYESGFGYIATIPNENKGSIEIKHLSYVDSPDFQAAFICERIRDYNKIDQLPFRINANGTVLVNIQGEWQCIDPKGTIAIQKYSDMSNYTSNTVWPIIGTSDYLIHRFDGAVLKFVDSSKKEELLASSQRKFIRHINETMDLVPFITKSASAWLGDSDDVFSVQCDGEKLLIWINGELQRTEVIPERIKWYKEEEDTFHSFLKIGSNGQILLSDHSLSQTSTQESIAIYDYFNNEWIIPADGYTYEQDSILALGTAKEKMAVLNKFGTIKLINTSHLFQEKMEIETDCSIDGVIDFRFVLNDNYLVVYSEGAMIRIYNTDDGICVYRGYLATPKVSALASRVSATLDSLERRVYIIDSYAEIGLCLDYDSWLELGQLKNVYAYDPTENVIYYPGKDGVYARHMPTLEEIIDIGHSLLDQQYELFPEISL